MLLVVPGGTGLDVAREIGPLQSAFPPDSPLVTLDLHIGEVTPASLREKLAGQQWDLVHYIGHGAIVNDEFGLLLNNEGDREQHYVPAETLASNFQGSGVQLVVFNCCLANHAATAENMNGVSDLLMRSGVPAVVTTRYEITDVEGEVFSRAFYHALFKGKERGYVDRSVQRARAAIMDAMNNDNVSARSFCGPVLHLVESNEALFPFTESTPAPAPSVPVVTPSSELELPPKLMRAIATGKCVPVIGPALLRAGAQRQGTLPAGLREVVERIGLRDDYKYPAFDEELRLCTGSAAWLTDAVMRRVAQHYESERERFELAIAIDELFNKEPPPQVVVDLAKLGLPTTICTHFDGLLEKAYVESKGAVPVIRRLDVDPERAGLSDPRIVYLRGSWQDPDSLIVTQTDHDRALRGLEESSERLVSFFSGSYPGRSFLFLGVDPQDILVRCYFGALLSKSRFPLSSQSYFVIPEPDPIDRAYWRGWDKVEWLQRDPAALIAALAEGLASNG